MHMILALFRGAGNTPWYHGSGLSIRFDSLGANAREIVSRASVSPNAQDAQQTHPCHTHADVTNACVKAQTQNSMCPFYSWWFGPQNYGVLGIHPYGRSF